MRDIFISYKNDGEGNNFAARLAAELTQAGFSVYFNPNEQHAGDFPERLKEAVGDCNDFLLVLTQSCLDQLKAHNKVDWVREELLLALNNDKQIIPLLMPGVTMPKDREDMPQDLQFLPDKDAITMSEPLDKSPIALLKEWMKSKPTTQSPFKDTFNSNARKHILDDMDTLLSGAEKGNPDSMYELALMYYYGLIGSDDGCDRDFNKAYSLLENLANGTSDYSAMAHSLIAEMYYHGITPRESQSYSKALEHHEKAKSTSGFSSREVAYLKSRGCGCDFDYNNIVEEYNEAIKKGDSMAILGLARFFMQHGRYSDAADLYRRTSNILPEAEYKLGMLYRDGLLSDPPKPDYFKAAFYFQHAISSGKCSSDVYHELGRLYFTPCGDFPKDFLEAEKNFKIAADMGNKKAQYKLGLMYEYGYVNTDIEKAIHYHTLAASNGVAFSAYHLAMLYNLPQKKNYQEAFKYAEIAANKGVMEGEFLFATYLYYGRGCEADEDKAYIFFKRAYEHGMCAAKPFIEKYNKISNGDA